MKKWRCKVCGYIHEGDAPPKRCPICGSPAKMFEELHDKADDKPDASTDGQADVLVVGSGAAAFSAAITARESGLTVIMLEKAAEVGGTTARSGGGFWIPGNRHQQEAGIVDLPEDAMRYMARYSYPHLYDADAPRYGLPKREYALIESYCGNAKKAVGFLEQCGAFQTIMEINWTGKPQVDYMNHLPENKDIRGRTLFSVDDEGKLSLGHNLIRVFSAWAAEHGIRIYTGHEVVEILQDETGAAIGVVADCEGERLTFLASKGVIFGSGGYSHDPELMLQWQRGPHFGGCSVPTNTGDFIRLAGSIGAALGNTAGAFRAQSMAEVYLEHPEGSSNVFFLAGDSMLVVNKHGRRIMDEKRDYTDRGMTHFVWDPVRAEWSNMLQFMIWDARTAELWQGYPPFPVQGQTPPYLISGNTWEELTANIEARLLKIAKHTGSYMLAPDFIETLEETVGRFNGFARTGKDLDFGRGDYAYDREWTTFPPTLPDAVWPDPDSPNYTMHPLRDDGPYYAIILGAGTLDTNGGPMTDGRGRVLTWDGKPIPGLYGAGNCIASPTANAYWGGGSTIGPALTFGYLAAKDASTR